MTHVKITKEQRDAIVERSKTLSEYCVKMGFTNKAGTSYKPEQVAHLNPPTNDEISAVEVFDFINDPPKKYFLYVNEEKQHVQTWTGDWLGNVTFGKQWRDCFGGVRVSVRVYAINGRQYAGTYYKSAGDYARVKLCKFNT